MDGVFANWNLISFSLTHLSFRISFSNPAFEASIVIIFFIRISLDLIILAFSNRNLAFSSSLSFRMLFFVDKSLCNLSRNCVTLSRSAMGKHNAGIISSLILLNQFSEAKFNFKLPYHSIWSASCHWDYFGSFVYLNWHEDRAFACSVEPQFGAPIRTEIILNWLINFHLKYFFQTCCLNFFKSSAKSCFSSVVSCNLLETCSYARFPLNASFDKSSSCR